MDVDYKKIKKLTTFCRKNGLLHLKVGDIELNLLPAAIELPEPASQASQESPKESETQFSEDDALFWSAPGHINTEGQH